MQLPFRRPLSLVITLLYLLVAGAEVLHHAWAEPSSGVPRQAHVHGEGDEHCAPALHDELHCPACKLGGMRTLPASPSPALAAIPVAAPLHPARDRWAPALRSHAPPSLRAPPLG